MLSTARYIKRITTKVPKRYRSLYREVYRAKAKTILEIGTYNGIHASQMIDTATIFHNPSEIEYYGFDLFESLSDELLKKELSKKPPTQKTVEKLLKKTGAQIYLYAGFTQNTLPEFVKEYRKKEFDFIFIDGGHAIETITSDWKNIEKILTKKSTVIFDDYYPVEINHLKGFGCQKLIDKLDKSKYDVEILPYEDIFEHKWGVLHVQFAKVKLK